MGQKLYVKKNPNSKYFHNLGVGAAFLSLGGEPEAIKETAALFCGQKKKKNKEKCQEIERQTINWTDILASYYI